MGGKAEVRRQNAEVKNKEKIGHVQDEEKWDATNKESDMDKKLMKMMLVAASAGICFCAADLEAWQKKPIDYARCKEDGKNERRCKKENREDNLHDFGINLSTDSFTVFNDFSPAEKDRAMNYADANKMSPDEAVDRVRAGK